MKTLLCMALALILAVITLECIIRNVRFKWSSTRLGADGTSNSVTTVVWRLEGNGVSHWNADGVRSRTNSSYHGKSILAIGDSFTESYQVNDDEVFTAVLENQLKARGVGLPVLNLGASGAALPQYIAKANHHKARFSPEWTVIQLRDEDLTKEAWAVERFPRFETNSDGKGIHLVLQKQGKEPHSKLYQAYPQLYQHVAFPIYLIERFMLFRMMFKKEAPLFKAGYLHSSSAMEEPGLSAYPLAQEIELVRDAYEGRLTILYLAPYDPRAPMIASPMEIELHKSCKQHGINFVTTRSLHDRFKSRSISPFGFPNSNFNVGHCNREGHQAIADLLVEEIHKMVTK